MKSDPSVHSALAASDLVSYEAGINDFLSARFEFIGQSCGGSDNEDCLRTMVASFDDSWDLLVHELRSRAPRAGFLTMNIYYPTALYDQAMGYFARLNPYLLEMNAHIAANPGGAFADIHLAFNGPSGSDDPYAKGYLLPDDVHPNSSGHQVIFLQMRDLESEAVAQGIGARDLQATIAAGKAATVRDEGRGSEGSADSPGALTVWLAVAAGAAAALAVGGGAAWYVRRSRGRPSIGP